MACGFSPNLALMMEQMAREKEKSAHDAELALAATTQHVERVKQKSARLQDASSSSNSSSSYDWTKTYEKWDAWEDPEELARQEQEARERSERAAKAQMGCNHDHSAEQKLMDMTTHAKLTACDEFRRLGNRFFQHGQYQRAAYHYHKALVYFEYIFPDTDAEDAWHDALKLKVLLNFAACRLKTGHLDDVIHHADQALALEPQNVKALYRRAQAHRLRDDFELALADITAASDAATTPDPLLVHERNLLQAKVLAYKLRSKQVSSAMFQDPVVGRRQADVAATASDTTRLSRSPDASVLRVELAATPRPPSEAPETALFDTSQPCTLGLAALEAVLTTLRAAQ